MAQNGDVQENRATYDFVLGLLKTLAVVGVLAALLVMALVSR